MFREFVSTGLTVAELDGYCIHGIHSMDFYWCPIAPWYQHINLSRVLYEVWADISELEKIGTVVVERRQYEKFTALVGGEDRRFVHCYKMNDGTYLLRVDGMGVRHGMSAS